MSGHENWDPSFLIVPMLSSFASACCKERTSLHFMGRLQ